MNIWDKTLTLSTGRSARKAKQQKAIKTATVMSVGSGLVGAGVVNHQAVVDVVSSVDLTGASLFVMACVAVIHLVLKIRNREEF